MYIEEKIDKLKIENYDFVITTVEPNIFAIQEIMSSFRKKDDDITILIEKCVKKIEIFDKDKKVETKEGEEIIKFLSSIKADISAEFLNIINANFEIYSKAMNKSIKKKE